MIEQVFEEQTSSQPDTAIRVSMLFTRGKLSTHTHKVILAFQSEDLRAEYTLDKLLNICRPFPNPFRLQAHSQRAACAFALERTNLISTDTFGEPDSACDRNPFPEALVQKNLAADTVWNGSAQPSQRNSWVGEITKPAFALVICR